MDTPDHDDYQDAMLRDAASAREALAAQIAKVQRGQEEWVTRLPVEIQRAVSLALVGAVPTEDEMRWMRAAIKAQADAAAFRKAIIEKSAIGVILFLMGWLGYALIEVAKAKLGIQ